MTYLKWNVWRFKIGIALHYEGKKDVFGYTNRCDDGKFIVFLDYDDIPLSWVMKEISSLQNHFKLGDFYIMQSSDNSYHAVCFSKVYLKTLMSILYNSSVDENYHRIPFTIGKRLLTLRLSKKNGKGINFICKLNGFDSKLESREHKIFFNNLFDIINKKDLYKNNDFDNPTEIICSHYKIRGK